MDIKRVLRIIFIFLILYILMGIILGMFIGDHTFIEEFTISKSDAMMMVFGWPFIILLVTAGQYGKTIIISGVVLLTVFAFLIWLSYFIEKKLFSKKEIIQIPSQN